MRPAKDLVLALYPFTRGLAFTLFEGPLAPIDWGVKDIRGRQKNARSFEAAKQIIDRLQPDIIVLLDTCKSRGRHGARIPRLQQLIQGHAEGLAIDVYAYRRKEVRDCFKSAGAQSRYEAAQLIASRIHAFGHRLPPVRKLWKSEALRMGLFDAASLALTFYCRNGVRKVLGEIRRP